MATHAKAAHTGDSSAAAHAQKTSSSVYESNPFRSSLTGLVTLLKVNPIASLLLAVVLVLGAVGAALVAAMLTALAPAVGGLAIAILVIIALPVLLGAYASLAVSSIQGKTRPTMEFFSDGVSKILPVLGSSILIGLIVALGLILFVIPGLIFMAWFSMTHFVIFDENVGAIEAMKRSKKLVDGHVLEVVGSFFAGMFLSTGDSLLGPVVNVAPFSGRYQQLKALKSGKHESPPVHWMNYIMPVLAILFLVALVSYFTATFNAINQKAKENDLQNQLQQIDNQYHINSGNPSIDQGLNY